MNTNEELCGTCKADTSDWSKGKPLGCETCDQPFCSEECYEQHPCQSARTQIAQMTPGVLAKGDETKASADVLIHAGDPSLRYTACGLRAGSVRGLYSKSEIVRRGCDDCFGDIDDRAE